jgi:hypothetical protein
LRTRRLLVMLDTCFSGAFTDDSRGFSIGARGGTTNSTDDFLRMEGHGRVVVTACGPNEVARETANHSHGNFTQAILSVIERGIDSGDRRAKVPALLSDICDEVHRETRGAQTPSLHISGRGTDWTIPLPPPAPYQAPLPSWAFVGTSGGVGKTTLAMMTAELLAESGNTVLYLDADIAQYGGTNEWCHRASADLGQIRTFTDHVATFSHAQTSVPSRNLTDRLLDVTPDYLKRYECGRILLLPASRASDKNFAFDLVAEIKNRRSNAACRQILDAAFDRGVRQGATCIVIDCGAQFDPLSVNSIAAAHHPFIVAAARAGEKDKRETILSNCTQIVDDFNPMRVETVVNRAPSREALLQHWGEPGFGRGFHWLPFDRKLFQSWEEGRPNFELGNPGWAETERNMLSRLVRRSYLSASAWLVMLAVNLTSMLLHIVADRPEGDASFLPQWLAITLTALAAVGLLGNVISQVLLRRRRRVLDDVIKHSVSRAELKKWFDVPVDEGAWWMVWRSSRRAAIEWLHTKVAAARAKQLPIGAAFDM